MKDSFQGKFFYSLIEFSGLSAMVILISLLIAYDQETLKRFLLILVYIGSLFYFLNKNIWTTLISTIWLGAIINFVKRFSYLGGGDRVVIYSILFLFDALLFIIFFNFVIRNKLRIRNNWLNYCVILFVVIAMVQIFNPATNLMANIVGLKMTVFYICAFYIGQTLSFSEKGIIRFAKVTRNIAFITAIYGIYQHFYGMSFFELAWANDPKSVGQLYLVGPKGEGIFRVFSTMEGPHQFGVFLGTSLLFYSITRKLNIIMIFQIIVIFIALYFTYTKTAWAIAIVGASLLLLFRKYRIIDKPFWIVRIALKVFLPLAIIFLIQFVILPQIATWSKSRALQERSQIGTLIGRMNIYKFQIKRIKENPIGEGAGATGTAAIKFSTTTEGTIVDNYYLQIAINLGWLGLLIFIFILILGLRGCGQALYKINNYCAKKIIIISMINIMTVSLMLITGNYFDAPFMAFYFWFLLGSTQNSSLFKMKEYYD